MEGARVFSSEWRELESDMMDSYELLPQLITNEPEENQTFNMHTDLQPYYSAHDSGTWLEQASRTYHYDRKQYIDRHSVGETLPYSARFHLYHVVCELLGDKFVLFIGSSYVLRVSVGQIDGINDEVSFDDAIRLLLDHLTVERVLLDLDGEKCDKAAQTVIEHLRANISSGLECRKSAELLFQLFKIFIEPSHTKSLVQGIADNRFIEESLKEKLVDYLQTLGTLEYRQASLNAVTGNRQFQINPYENLVKDSIQLQVKHYQKVLLASYPSKLTERLKKKEGGICFYVSTADLKLFSELENMMTTEPFNETLSIIRDNYIEQLGKTEVQSLDQLIPLSNQIYFFICKSLMELSKELQETYEINEIINYGDSGLGIHDQPDDGDLLKSSLLQQMRMLVNLANHYAPGTTAVNQKFPHKFIYLKIKNGIPQDMNDHIWLSFLDGSIGHIYAVIPNSVRLFSELIDFYANYILSGKFGNASPESLRTITHQLLQFVAQAGALMISGKENALNKKVLQQQISGIVKHEMTVGELRDLLEKFTCHWKQCDSVLKSISDRLVRKIFIERNSGIQRMLSEIVSHALSKNVKGLELIAILRSVTDFLEDVFTSFETGNLDDEDVFTTKLLMNEMD